MESDEEENQFLSREKKQNFNEMNEERSECEVSWELELLKKEL